MMKMGFHPFHLVENSPWPILSSVSIFNFLTFSYLFIISETNLGMFLLIKIGVCMVCIQWWRDVVREGTYQGKHSHPVLTGLQLGMFFFILSELMFFFSMFFGFFFISLSPDIFIGCNWPPLWSSPVPWEGVPLMNTVILLSSGVSITWAHYAILSSNKKEARKGLLITFILGLIFSLFQGMEYLECKMSMKDSVYESLFYITTGFHGLHVMIGTLFIMVCLFRVSYSHMSKYHHVGFESASWYWHFVDVVWMFLYIFVYWWSC